MPNSSHRDVFISSTTRDLEQHRQVARDAAWRASLFPLMMERDVAGMEDPIEYSLRLVEDAEIYIGIFALRYGYVPVDDARNPQELSITELEYRHAIKRGIPTLIFVMDEEHLVKAGHIENEPDKLAKLNRLKDELRTRHVVGFFKSADDLSNQVFQALQSHKIQHYITKLENQGVAANGHGTGGGLKPYFAHAYIQPHNFVGRRVELAALDEWAQSKDVVLLVKAIGGVGKSALTWEWVRQQTEKPVAQYAGIMWWSFYESHSALENLIPKALAYITGEEEDDFKLRARAENERLLLEKLQAEPYLIVFDGIERILVAYQRIDSSHLDTDEAVKERQLRGCADPRDDEFLNKLVNCAPSKFLVSTRLIPQAFTSRQGDMMRGVRSIDLLGLAAEDALALMNELGVTGNPENMVRFMAQFGNHSLLLSIIAGRIVNYRPAPGSFDDWYAEEGRELKLSDFELEQRRTHILQYALDGLTPDLRRLLGQIATFRYPVDYRTLNDINPFMPDLPDNGGSRADLVNVRVKLHNGLKELEDRGLLLWDRVKNRYDLHPIVRGYAYEQMEEQDRRMTFRQMHSYFANLPPEDLDKVEKLDDLKRSLELYEVLVRLGRWDDAMDVYDKHLKYALTYKLATYDTIVDLLMPLFPDGLDELPRLSSYRGQNICLTDMATAFSYLGQTDKAMTLRGLKIKLSLKQKSYSSMGVGLRTYSSSLRLDQNKIATSLKVCKLALEVAEASGDLDNAGITYMYLLSLYRDMGWWIDAKDAYDRFNELLKSRPALKKWQATADRFYAEMLIFQKRDANDLLNKIWRDAQKDPNKNQVHIREIYRLRGESALQQGQFSTAAGFFLDTITLGHKSGIPVSGLLGRLAYVRACEELQEEAQQLLTEALTDEEAGRLHDLYNSAAETYLMMGDQAQAAQYAAMAYETAWADGLPFVWWWRLERARQVLGQVQAPIPDLPPFDEERIEKVPYEADIYAFISELQQDVKP